MQINFPPNYLLNNGINHDFNINEQNDMIILVILV